jgi:type I restriction enzyme R subunit
MAFCSKSPVSLILYLADYDSVGINSGITMKGLFLREGEEVGLVDTQTGKRKSIS